MGDWTKFAMKSHKNKNPHIIVKSINSLFQSGFKIGL